MHLMRLAISLTALVALALAAQHPARADSLPAQGAGPQAANRIPATLPHAVPAVPAAHGASYVIHPNGAVLSPYRQVFWTQPPQLTALQVRQRLALQGICLPAPPPLPHIEPTLPSPKALEKNKDKEMEKDKDGPKQPAPPPGP
jgi:hypothetical protein